MEENPFRIDPIPSGYTSGVDFSVGGANSLLEEGRQNINAGKVILEGLGAVNPFIQGGKLGKKAGEALFEQTGIKSSVETFFIRSVFILVGAILIAVGLTMLLDPRKAIASGFTEGIKEALE